MSTDAMNTGSPITENDLHALVDGLLEESRAREVEAYLDAHPDAARRVNAWKSQRRELHRLYSPVMSEKIPRRLRQLEPQARSSPAWPVWRIAASVLIALVGGMAGWGLRGQISDTSTLAVAPPTIAESFVQRAAIAHAVYVPDQRRPVEISAAHEDQLVTWLSKRMGARMSPPSLQALGYKLEGGRLLPGGQGPVAQFMYEDASGMRLTLYVTNEGGAAPAEPRTGRLLPAGNTAFQFAQDGAVNVFYWIDGAFGYALSSYAGRTELARVSAEVYRQLEQGRQ